MVDTTTKGRFFLNVGAGAVTAGTIYGISSLTYYGLGLSREPSAWRNIKNHNWPGPVKLNIQRNYVYLFFSFYICIFTSFFVFTHPLLLRIFSSFPFVLLDIVIETLVQQGKIFAYINTEGYFNYQKVAWVCYCAFIGALSSTYLRNNVDSIHNSLRISVVVLVGLITLALTAPVTKYYDWMSFIHRMQVIISLASMGATMVSVKSTLGAFFLSVSLYGGLLIFSLNFLSHAQEAHIKALYYSRGRRHDRRYRGVRGIRDTGQRAPIITLYINSSEDTTPITLRDPGNTGLTSDAHSSRDGRYIRRARHVFCAPAMSTPLLLSSMSIFARIILLFKYFIK